MTSLKSIEYDDIARIMNEHHGIDLYEIEYPKVEVDDEIGQRLHDHFMTLHMVSIGMDRHTIHNVLNKESRPTWRGINKGRRFNFWHYCQNLMEPNMVTRSSYHEGWCVINRDMIKDSPSEVKNGLDSFLLTTFCFPEEARGDRYAKPVIEKILDHFGVDELKITTRIGR